MKLLWDWLRSTYAGSVVRAYRLAVFRLREIMPRKRLRCDIKFRMTAQYRYWRNVWMLKHHIRSERLLLKIARQRYEKRYRESDDEPMVSVIIPTWNRGELLVSRTLPSVLNQSYSNLEIIVVGDCCTDNTADLIASMHDTRLHFYNLPERGKYPPDKKSLWQVAGSAPKNKGLELASGSWIAPLDDDDVFTPDHVESLLRYAQTNDLELVYGKLMIEESAGKWKEKGVVNTQMSIQNSTMLFRSYLRLFRSDINAWRYGLTVDYQRTIRYRASGVRIGYLDKIVALMPLRPGQVMIGLSASDRPGVALVNSI